MTHEKRHEQGSNRWFTPEKYIALAELVMGGRIVLDPASDSEANEYVKALHYFDTEKNGLLQKWEAKRVWLNAPGKVLAPKDHEETPEEKRERDYWNQYLGQERWQNKLLHEYNIGNVEQAIMLIFNASSVDTHRIQDLKGRYAYCEVEGRIKFIPPKDKYIGAKNSPTQPSAFVYFGSDPTKFYDVFSDVGLITMIGGVYRKTEKKLPMFPDL